MKKALILALSVLMISAFISCDNNVNEPRVEVTSEGELTEALSAAATGEPKNIVIVESFEVSGNIAINVDGIKLSAENDAVLTANTSGTSETPFHLVDVNANGVVFNNVRITASGTQCIWAVNVNGNDFVYDGGAITGADNDNSTYSAVNMGIVISANSTGTEIRNVTLKDCFTPVYSSSADVTIEKVVFNSGMQFERATVEDTKISGCSKLSDGTYTSCAVDVRTDYGTSEDVAKSVLDGIIANNTGVTGRLNGSDYTPSN